MISRDDIQDFVNRLVARFRPMQVILFGSYAYGRPTADSDVDLLVVMPHPGPGTRAATRIRRACPRQFPLDLIVRSPAEVRRGPANGDPFLSEVVTKGIILHEASNTRVG